MPFFLVSHLQINYQLKIFLHEKCNDEGVHTCIYVTDRETLRIFLVKSSNNKFIFDTKYEMKQCILTHLFFGKWNAIKTIHWGKHTNFISNHFNVVKYCVDNH